MVMSGQAVAGATKAKVTRGYIDGCFDIMHSGHYNAIRQAKMVCDQLVVGVHSDEEIAENKALPVMRQDERYALLEHIKWIDEIVYDVPYSPLLETLEKCSADFCVHGDDMPVNAQGECAYDKMKDAGKLRIIKRTEGVSTTDLIGRLLTLSRQEQRDHKQRPRGNSQALERRNAEEVFADLFGDAASDVDTVINRLVQKYQISREHESELLQVLARAAKGSPRAAGGAEGSPKKLFLPDGMRTNSPVQLLASTRRITEFSMARQPNERDTVVYVSGAFDMFHVGHAQFLKEAKALGTFLCVGVHDDVSVQEAKGQCFPVMTLNERVLNVCACKWVDEVVIGAPRRVTDDLIKTWNIKVVAQGTEHKRFAGAAEARAGLYDVAHKMGIHHEIPSRWPHLCHDAVVERIMRDREVYTNRNKDRARREDAYYQGKQATSVEA